MRPHIAFLDSGAGGLPYLSRTRELLPDAVYSYVGDPAFFPYGQKTPDTLIDIITANTERIIGRLKPDMIVIACNTASVVALETLRRRFDLPFVGVVPAVKPAAGMSKNGRIGILATSETVGNPYTQHLIDAFACGTEVFRFAGVDIVNLVEQRFFSVTEAEKRTVLEDAATYFVSNRVDAVVLGCTHFLHVKTELSELMNGTAVVDSVEGVARQVLRIAAEVSNTADAPQASLYLASATDNPHCLDRFADRFLLEYKGALN